jgi:hypothetical protein
VLLLALAAAFFGWVSAEPFWLSVGHGHTGNAIVVASSSAGCRARFAGDAARDTVGQSTVELAGVRTCTVGASMPARMVSADADRAYAASPSGLVARWSVGYGLVLACGLLTALVAGARRYRGWARAGAVAIGLGAPVTLALALLVAAY